MVCPGPVEIAKIYTLYKVYMCKTTLIEHVKKNQSKSYGNTNQK